MAKLKNNQEKNLELTNNIEKQNGEPLIKDYTTIENLLKNFSNGEGTINEQIISDFLNEGKFKLLDLQDIEIGADFLEKLDGNIKLNPTIQTAIAKLFLQKLKGQIESISNVETQEEMKEQFDFDFKHKNKRNPLKPIISNLNNYKDLLSDIKITNKEIFNEAKILERNLPFNETSPSTQSEVSSLIAFEIKDTLDKYGNNKNILFNDTDNLFQTGKNKLNKIFNSNNEIQELLQKKHNLEDNEDIEGTKAINKEIWRKHIEQLENEGNNEDLVSVLKKLIQNNFDFRQLSDKEQQTIIDLSINKKIDSKNKFAKQLGKYTYFNLEEYNKFLENIYNFEKKEDKQTIKIGNKELNLKIKKNFEKGEHNQFNNFEEFKNMDHLPLSYIVNIDENDEDIIKGIEDPLNPIFSVWKNNNGIITTYTTKNGNIIVGNGYRLEIGGKKITKNILDHLLDCRDEDLETELKNFGLYEGLKENIKKVKDSYSEKKAGTNLFKQILANTDVKIIERDLILKGKDIDKLSHLYLLPYLNGLSQTKDLQGTEQNIEDKFDGIANNKKEGINSNNDGLEGADREGTEGKEKGKEYANEIFEKIKNDYPDTDDEIENYSIDNEIIDEAKNNYKKLNKEGKKAFRDTLTTLGNSTYNDSVKDVIENLDSNIVNRGTKNEYTNAELGKPEEAKTEQEKFDNIRENISGSKECKFEKGTILYFKKQDSKLPPHELTDSYYKFELGNIPSGGPDEGKTFEIIAYGNELGLTSPKTYTLPYTVEHLKKITESNEVFKMNNQNNKQRDSCMKNIEDSKIISKFSTFGNMEGQIQFKGDKFVKKDEKGNDVEIKYLDLEVENTGKKNTEGGTNLVKYEIKGINTARGTVNISTNFDGRDEKDPNKKTKYEYERELPFDQFILLAESKNLKGYSTEEETERETLYKDEEGDRLPHRGLFQRVSIGNFKNIFKGKTKEIKDALKAQSAENEEQLENWMFSREGLNLYEHLGNIISFGGLRGNMKAAFDGAELDYYNNRDNKIWKKIDYWYKRYADDPIFSAGFKQNIVGILTPGYKGKGVKRYQVAGAFLAMLKKEGPYPRSFQDKEGQGYRVEMFLGPDHKAKFLNAYKKKQAEVNEIRDRNLSGGEKMQSMVDLQKFELQYIIDTIDDSGENAPSNENKAWKSVWSNKFKDELKSNMDSRVDGFNKPSDAKTYNQAKENFINNIGNNKQHKAIPELIKMCEKAGRPEQIHEVKGYLLMVLMLGIARPSKEAEEKLWKTARSIGFLPGYRGKDTNVGEKIEILLKGISKNNPSIKEFNPNEILSGNFKEKNNKFMAYRGTIDNGNGTKILKYIENPRYGGDNSIKKQSENGEEPYKLICKEILKKFEDNSDLGNLSGDVNNIVSYIKAAPLTATYNTIRKYIPKDGRYTVDDEQQGDAKDIWNAISNYLSNSDNDLDFYMTMFNNLISNEFNMTKLCKTIPLIKRLKSNGKIDEAKYIRYYIFYGQLYDKKGGKFPPEFDSCINKFGGFFFNNIEKIDEKKIKSKFGPDSAESYKNPYSKINRELWNNYEDNRKLKLFTDHREYYDWKGCTINEEIQIIKKNLKNKGIDRIPEPKDLKDDIEDKLNKNIEDNSFLF